jgi:DNA mismatch repair protein PMS2
LDADATNIEVKFFNYGLGGFEVTDNGKGINENNFEIVCKRGTTSKIQNYLDIYKIKSLGFRGEALSSLCNMGTLTI